MSSLWSVEEATRNPLGKLNRNHGNPKPIFCSSRTVNLSPIMGRWESSLGTSICFWYSPGMMHEMGLKYLWLTAKPIEFPGKPSEVQYLILNEHSSIVFLISFNNVVSYSPPIFNNLSILQLRYTLGYNFHTVCQWFKYFQSIHYIWLEFIYYKIIISLWFK